MTFEQMVKQFQCLGCVTGSDPKSCDAFKLRDLGVGSGKTCGSHVSGTMIFPTVGKFVLGLPKGFCREGDGKLYVRLFPKGELTPKWDKFNVPVWAMEQEGFLYVRTYSPRVNYTYVDVIEDGTFALFNGREVIDVGGFIDDID